MFTGKLLEDILNNLNNEFYTLYLCSLIYSILSIDEDEELVLKENGINTEFSKTLFDYTKFLKVLDLSRLKNTVEE
ncbi:hypothetical protein F8M41_025535 [Gigaspora margarita]|uniref:Uncharacterized protein n=1 Tax=Gigaspora margarita TaxID=4874 RepID=A0A8H4A9S3_GIGMA|nr:hypothetical protein F8M41_025535 [Gigaspora margarita]